MERSERYVFGGFTFGTQKLFQLTINIRNLAEGGTFTVAELGLELNETERQQLIKVLVNEEGK